MNLISNALKFTNQGGITITLSTSPILNSFTKNSNNNNDNNNSNSSNSPLIKSAPIKPIDNLGRISLFFTVEDTGIGMSSESSSKLFSPATAFSLTSQLSLVNYSTSGGNGNSHGLGLIICRKIIEAMEGTIMVESERGKGSVFHVQLPSRVIPPSREEASMISREKRKNSTELREDLERVTRRQKLLEGNEFLLSSFIDKNSSLDNSDDNNKNGSSSGSPLIRASRPKFNKHILIVEDNTINQRILAASLKAANCTYEVDIYLSINQFSYPPITI